MFIITLVSNNGLVCNEDKIILVVDCQLQMSNVNIKCFVATPNKASK